MVAAMTQFSELRDASSKPWTQLSSFTALVFLLLTQSCSGVSQLPVLATVGADVLLSCRLEPADDASGMSIEWSREDLDRHVYVWWPIERESVIHPDYEGRTSLLFSQLEFGNISLKLSNVTQADKGKYRCFIPTLDRGCTVELVVDDFFKVQSSKNSTIVGLAVSLTAAFILIILAVFLFVCTRRQKREKKTLVNQQQDFAEILFRITNQLKLEKQKIENLEYELEERTTVMSKVLVKILEDLNDDELHKFLQFLPAIPKSQLQTPDKHNTVDVMVETYGLQGAVQRTRMILEKIPRNDLLQRLPSSSSGPEGYGNIVDVETTGDSAQWHGLDYSGVRASHTMAKEDSERMKKYRSKINAVGRKYNIEPALIAAIISTRSRAGHVLQDGWGGYKCWGLMQVSTDPNRGGHEAKGAWDSKEHLCQGTEILVCCLNEIHNKFPSWTREQQLKGGIAAYMAGSENVHSYENVDENTAGKDFSNDVVARAQWYKENFF